MIVVAQNMMLDYELRKISIDHRSRFKLSKFG